MVNENRDYLCVFILFLVNLCNNMDRYTIAGVLPDVQHYYSINDSMGGLIQTVFLISFMVVSPICGYLGDRYNRKYIMMIGMVIWLVCVCASTFVPGNLFPVFLVIRSFVGVGEASYVNICPTIIGDMFTSDKRTKVYMFYYLAVPVGSGLGYIISSRVAAITHEWQWGVRVTGIFGIIALALLAIFVYEPVRGASEVAEGRKQTPKSLSYIEDLKVIIKCKTYIFITIGYTCLIFVSGTLSWWIPTILEYGLTWNLGYNSIKDLPTKYKNEIGSTFGVITSLGGVVGVLLGNLLAQALINGWFGSCLKTKRGHAIAAGIGGAITLPCLIILFTIGYKSEVLSWITIAVALVGICFNWSLNVEVINNVIAAERRSTAFAYDTLISHLFGDASGPYIIGLISDVIQNSHPTTAEWEYKSLAYASLTAPIMMTISICFYMLAAYTFVGDARRLKEGIDLAKNQEIRVPELSPVSQMNVEANTREENNNQVDTRKYGSYDVCHM